MRKPAIAFALAFAFVVATMTMATGAPGISITSPADGATVPGGSLDIAGDVSFIEPVPTERQFFQRRTDCNEDKRLSVVQGAESSGCAYTASITPLNEDSRLADLWPAEDGVPFTLDASRDITGVITLSSFQPPVYVGAGLTTVDISVTANRSTGQQVSLGSTSVNYVALPGQTYSTPWEITPPADLDKQDFRGLTLSTTVRGVNAMHGFTIPNASHMTLPIYSASFNRAVEVAVNAGSFTSMSVVLSEDLASFGATVPVCFCNGESVVRARAVQGGQVIATDSITVTTSV